MIENIREEKTFFLTWDIIHKDCKELARKVKKHGPWNKIVAITRGGMVPAAILSCELDIRVIDTVCMVSYDDKVIKDHSSVLKGIEGDGEGVLIVDDLSDTGMTARVIRQMLPKGYLAAVYVKPLAQGLVDTYVHEVNQDTWIYFPWDKHN